MVGKRARRHHLVADRPRRTTILCGSLSAGSAAFERLTRPIRACHIISAPGLRARAALPDAPRRLHGDARAAEPAHARRQAEPRREPRRARADHAGGDGAALALRERGQGRARAPLLLRQRAVRAALRREHRRGKRRVKPFVTCPYCATKACVVCKIRWHDALTCDEIKVTTFERTSIAGSIPGSQAAPRMWPTHAPPSELNQHAPFALVGPVLVDGRASGDGRAKRGRQHRVHQAHVEGVPVMLIPRDTLPRCVPKLSRSFLEAGAKRKTRGSNCHQRESAGSRWPSGSETSDVCICHHAAYTTTRQTGLKRYRVTPRRTQATRATTSAPAAAVRTAARTGATSVASAGTRAAAAAADSSARTTASRRTSTRAPATRPTVGAAARSAPRAAPASRARSATAAASCAIPRSSRRRSIRVTSPRGCSRGGGSLGASSPLDKRQLGDRTAMAPRPSLSLAARCGMRCGSGASRMRSALPACVVPDRRTVSRQLQPGRVRWLVVRQPTA